MKLKEVILLVDCVSWVKLCKIDKDGKIIKKWKKARVTDFLTKKEYEKNKDKEVVWLKAKKKNVLFIGVKE